MQITFQCTKCEARLEIDAESAGAEIACPTCGADQVVPRKGLESGTTIGGFKLVKLIGRGGMGEVYLARQLSLDRMVALKLLSRSGSLSGDAAERFVQEIRLTARLEHPYLVTAFEAGEDAGVLYLAMAYIRGASLHEHVRRRGPLSETDALILGRKLASALAHAWRELRLLHRDIKPSNILLDSNGEPRLADLGLAKCLDQNDGRTLAGALLGTPNYMSPEQAEGREDLDVRADIYSLGATLYTAVTGQIPYEAPSVMETLRRQAMEPLPDPRTFAPNLSDAFVELIGTLLARDRADRPKTWEALVALFDRLLTRHPGAAGMLPIVEAPSEAAGSLPPVPARTRSFAALAAGVVIAAALGVGSGLLWLRLRNAPGAGNAGPPPSLPEPSEAASDPGTTPLAAGADAINGPTAPPLPANPVEWRESDLLPGTGAFGDPAQRDRVFRAFNEAREWARLNPEDIDGQIERFRKVAAMAPGGPLGHRVQEMIRSAPAMKKRARGITEDKIRAGVDEALRTGRYDEALRRLEEFEGPFPEETRALREASLERLRQAKQDAERKAAQERLDALADRVAAGVLKGDYVAARSEADRAAADPGFAADLASVEALRSQVTDLAGVQTNLLRSFLAQKGREVTVELRAGKMETLQIADVRGGTVVGRRILKEGFIEVPFAPKDLSLREKERRLGLTTEPAATLALGLLALEGGDLPLAAGRFLGSGSALGSALVRSISARP
jgi:hypothetical protein